jgi:hypothetical protein
MYLGIAGSTIRLRAERTHWFSTTTSLSLAALYAAQVMLNASENCPLISLLAMSMVTMLVKAKVDVLMMAVVEVRTAALFEAKGEVVNAVNTTRANICIHYAIALGHSQHVRSRSGSKQSRRYDMYF